ncbi:hypothetical protein BT63DRAFT_152178 [Microthyrium microscopicum]|uniref:lytic cellulose monooxygenase (C4-dehydrogenating) n=1 Tax=Microthyrium microscopicum TaxID=703497 RepID=A0A6A6UNJ6_9PEZI|nr:hypothetical protein BT63DRAFT_152178 [Microthyrium microscopicum]
MAIWTSLLFVGAALAHSGVKSITVDGTAYPPFDSRIDHLLMPVRRIEWSHDIVLTTFNPIQNFTDPDLACRENAKPPLLKAPTRAGAEVTFYWTPITRMHQGPIITYLGLLPTPDTPPQQVKFFKIFEKGFDASIDRWANEWASENGDSYKVRIPSDIKSGTYILRTELIALHGNMKNLNKGALAGIQWYPYCFNLDIVGSGDAQPEGVTFPGAYKPTDPGFTFQPFMTYGNESGTEQNSKYTLPGPPLYTGKFEAPTGPRPVAKETGAYPTDLEVKYMDMLHKIERPGLNLATFVNSAWYHYKPDKESFKKYGGMVVSASKETKEIIKGLFEDIEAFKKLQAALPVPA